MSWAVRRLKAFGNSQAGSVAILFGISTFLLFGFAGLAVDYARGQSSRSSLQQDVDAMLLYIGSKVAKDPNFHDVQPAAQDYLDGLRRQRQVAGAVSVSVSQPDPMSYKAVAKAKVPTLFMGILGIPLLNLQVESEAQVGQKPVEFALVLDNTLSMEGSKLEALKGAAKSLVDTVTQGANARDFVKVGVVPFADYVNVGMDNRNKPWMSVPRDESTTQNVCQDVQQPTVVPGSCRDVPYTYLQDGVPKTGMQQQCEYSYGPPVHQCFDTTTNNVWYGCAGSRDYPYSVSDDYSSRPVPGAMNSICPNPVTPLTNDPDAVKSAIDAMTVVGNTYIPAGLTWGRAVLSSAAPFEEGQTTQKGQKVRKIMVLMTDGQNTISPTVPYNGYHWHSDANQANMLTSELCTNAKQDGVVVYTVAFDVNSPDIKTILQECATDPSKYHDASGSSELQKAFANIAADFSPLRLSR